MQKQPHTPRRGRGREKSEVFFENGYNFFFSMLKLRVEDFSKCLPYKASGAFELIPITFGRLEGKGERKGRKETGEREIDDVSLRGLKSETKLEASESRFQVGFLEIFFNSQLHSKLKKEKRKQKKGEARTFF